MCACEHAQTATLVCVRVRVQVIVWCMDSVPFPNLVFINPLSGDRNSVYCHDGLIRSALFTKNATKIVSCGRCAAAGRVYACVTCEPIGQYGQRYLQPRM